MKTAGIIGLSGLLAALGAAVPLEKRAYVYVTETHTEIIDVTKTVTLTGAPTTSTTTVAETTAETTSAPAQFYAPSSSESAPAATSSAGYSYSYSWDDQDTTSTTSTSEAAAYVPPTTTPPPAPTTSSPPAAEYTPLSSTSSAYQPPPSEEPKPSQPSGGSSGSSGGQFHGEITHYTAGMGSCGIVSDGNTENVVALSKDLMANPPGGNSNNHPNCGRKIKIDINGHTEEATVVDTCAGCKTHDLDLSEVLFKKYYDLEAGRRPCSWSWA